MRDVVLECTDFRVNYQNFKLFIEHYEVEKGYVTGLIGKNGSGKTTFINAFLELIRRDGGKIEILGLNFEENEVEIKERIAYVNDQFIFPLHLTAERLGKDVGPFYSKFNYEEFKTNCLNNQIVMDMPFKQYSKGMLAKISICFALAHHPDFIILDEPTANLDPVSRREILELLYDVMQEENRTILFSTHITSDLDKIADKITLIHNGRIEFTKTKDEIQEDNQIVYIQGEIPSALEKTLKGITKTTNGYKALCTARHLFEETPTIKFNKASIEDIMYYWEIQNV